MTKVACKKASLKIEIIREVHHGLRIRIRNIVDSHDKLLSATILCSDFLTENFSTLFK